MKKIIIDDQEYELIENHEDGFDENKLIELVTDYFYDYDFILGDWSYGRLRLKGFCDKENKIFNEINDINKKDEYIKNQCAYGCKYFIIKKIK